MLGHLLILLIGLALVVKGADWLVDGSSAVARRAGLSEFLIGMTVVGIGTSMPELVVSLTGAIRGSADIAIGNVAGSNIFNVLLILGLTALIRPVGMTPGRCRPVRESDGCRRDAVPASLRAVHVHFLQDGEG